LCATRSLEMLPSMRVCAFARISWVVEKRVARKCASESLARVRVVVCAFVGAALCFASAAWGAVTPQVSHAAGDQGGGELQASQPHAGYDHHHGYKRGVDDV
jgi:hypothetical protein